MDLPQTPYMKDLDQIGIMAKAEMGFIKMIVSPLWGLLNTFSEQELAPIMINLNKNAESWEQVYLKNNNDPEKKSFLNILFKEEDLKEDDKDIAYKKTKSLFSHLRKIPIKSANP